MLPASSLVRPGTLFCSVCDHFFCDLHDNNSAKNFCAACYDARNADLPGAERDALTWKKLAGGDPESGQADLKAIEDTGKALEAEREKQAEADRVARRHTVRRQSSMTKPSAVARELEKLKRRESHILEHRGLTRRPSVAPGQQHYHLLDRVSHHRDNAT